MISSRKILPIFGFFVIALALYLPLLASAASTTLLAPIPGSGDAGKDLGSYLKAIFTYGIGLAALIAMAQLIFGAVQYVTSAGVPSLHEDAKGRMRNAIIGLVLLILSVVILNTFGKSKDSSYTISPELAAILTKAQKDVARGEANASAFKRKVILETVTMVDKTKRAEYLKVQEDYVENANNFTKDYVADAGLSVWSAHRRAFRAAVKEISDELSGRDFNQAVSQIGPAWWEE